MQPRFLIAKYISDTHRMEPRNIGIVAWMPGQVEARFLGESRKPGGRLRAPSFINRGSASVYKSWVESWRALLGSSMIESTNGRRSASVESQEYLDLLRGYSRDNYVLTEGGTSLDTVAPAMLADFADRLFEKFASEPPKAADTAKQQEARKLNAAFRHVMKEAGVANRPGFRHNWTLAFRINNTPQFLPFDGYLDDEQPSVYQKVALFRPESAYATAGYFDAVAKAGKVSESRCAALVHVPEGVPDDDERRSRYEWVKQHGRVINLADTVNAIREVQLIASKAA